MERILCVLITKDVVEPDCYKSIISQDYGNYSTMIHVERPKFSHPHHATNKYLNCSHNRNQARELALGSKADKFLFLDSDTVLPQKAIKNLASHDLDIVGGWYKMIAGDRWVSGKWVGPNKFCHFISPVIDKTVEVSMIGMGCAMLSRKALEALEFEPGHDKKVIESSSDQFMMMGECCQFSLRAKEKGFKIFMDGRVICDHIIRRNTA